MMHGQQNVKFYFYFSPNYFALEPQCVTISHVYKTPFTVTTTAGPSRDVLFKTRCLRAELAFAQRPD